MPVGRVASTEALTMPRLRSFCSVMVSRLNCRPSRSTRAYTGPSWVLNEISPLAATAQPELGSSSVLRQAMRSTTSCTLIPRVLPPPSGRVSSRSGGPAGPAELNAGWAAESFDGVCSSWMNPRSAS